MTAEQARARGVHAIAHAFFKSSLWFVWCGEEPLRIVNDAGELAREEAAKLAVETLVSHGWRERPERDASPVLVLDFAPPTLVFHLFEEWDARPHPERSEDGWIRNEHRTRCGIVTWRVEWRDVEGRTSSETRLNRGTVLRRDHAERIGRPCARCE